MYPTLASIDNESLVVERDCVSANADEVLAAFRNARERTVALIAGLSAEQFDRTAVFEGYGPVSLRSLVHYLCSHDQQHLAGLQWLLGKAKAPVCGDAAERRIAGPIALSSACPAWI